MIERVRNVDFPGALEYESSEWSAEILSAARGDPTTSELAAAGSGQAEAEAVKHVRARMHEHSLICTLEGAPHD